MGMNDEINRAVNWDTESVDMEDSIRIAIKKMNSCNTSALAVKSGGKVVGVLTDMDLMMCVAEKKDLDKTNAFTCMTSCEMITNERSKSPCVQLDSTQTVGDALGVMTLGGVHHLLVANDDEHLGIVSIIDLLKLAIS
jgi:CBS domain-containing protein